MLLQPCSECIQLSASSRPPPKHLPHPLPNPPSGLLKTPHPHPPPTLPFCAHRSVEDELKRESYTDASVVAISYLVMLGYITLALAALPPASQILHVFVLSRAGVSPTSAAFGCSAPQSEHGIGLYGGQEPARIRAQQGRRVLFAVDCAG
jgi:hypothetical protein